MIKIAMGADHGGVKLKEKIKMYLFEKGYEILDFGTDSTQSCNYAEFALDVAKCVGTKSADYGIICCTTGEGVCIAANKVKGVRAGIGYNFDVSQRLRSHNNANVICFGAEFTTFDEAFERVDVFLNTEFEGGRHIERVETITNYENNN